MAAHVFTALKQLHVDHVLDEKPVRWDQLQAALNLSCWTELLDLDDYGTLSGVVISQNPYRLAFWIGSMFSKYERKWYELGEPATMEQWIDSEYTQVCGGIK